MTLTLEILVLLETDADTAGRDQHFCGQKKGNVGEENKPGGDFAERQNRKGSTIYLSVEL